MNNNENNDNMKIAMKITARSMFTVIKTILAL